MASPNTSAYTRPDLGQMFSEFPIEAATQGFIATRIAPVFSVAEQAGVFPSLPIEVMLEQPASTARAPKAGYVRGDWEFEQGSYATVEHGAEEIMDDRLRKIYAYAIDFDRVCAARALGKVLRGFEIEVAAAMESTANFAGTTTATTAWTSHAAAVPIDDIQNALIAAEDAKGIKPNVMVITSKTLNHLRRCAQVVDRIKYAGIDDPKMAPEATVLNMLAQLLGVEEIFVANRFKDSAKKGQTASLARIWTDSIVALHTVPRTSDLEEPCSARTLIWSGDGAGPAGVFEQYREEGVRGDIMRFRHERQLKVLVGGAGYILTTVI